VARKTARKPTKKARAGASGRSAQRKKSATKKKTARSAQKKRTTKKSGGRKVGKKAGKKAGKKKVTNKVAKKTTKKKVTRKKTTTKKVTRKKVAKKTAKKAPAKKKTAAKAAAASKKKKTAASKTKKKSSRGRSLAARSVAEAASAGVADEKGYVYINGRRVRMISTAGQGIVKRSRTVRKTDPAEVEAAQPAKPIKTHLTAKQLRHYRDVLLTKRAELVGDVSAMETAALQSHGGNLSNLPIHMADIGTDTYDQDFMLGLAETERQRLVEIDDALARIADKTYGVCQMTGKPIPDARLDAKPWAKYTIEAARKIEGNWRAG
jgi:RNA polymerase-binding transcription factor DksA